MLTSPVIFSISIQLYLQKRNWLDQKGGVALARPITKGISYPLAITWPVAIFFFPSVASVDHRCLGPVKTAIKMSAVSEIYFNINDGYLEGLVRGFKGGILKQNDYLNLVQCEILEGKTEMNLYWFALLLTLHCHDCLDKILTLFTVWNGGKRTFHNRTELVIFGMNFLWICIMNSLH